MGGNNDKENLAHLYVRDHALAHWILFKIHRRLEDKVAYKMLLGKKKDAEKLRIQLALIAYPPHKRKQFFLKNNPSFDKELVKKAMNTKRLKYNGNVFSEEGMNNIKLANLGKKHSPESKIKLKLSMKAFLQSLTKEEKEMALKMVTSEQNARMNWLEILASPKGNTRRFLVLEK